MLNSVHWATYVHIDGWQHTHRIGPGRDEPDHCTIHLQELGAHHHRHLDHTVQRYLYTLDGRRGGLACPAGWRGFCRLCRWWGKLVYKQAAVVQTVSASSTEKHDSFHHQRGDICKLLLVVYIYCVLGQNSHLAFSYPLMTFSTTKKNFAPM